MLGLFDRIGQAVRTSSVELVKDKSKNRLIMNHNAKIQPCLSVLIFSWRSDATHYGRLSLVSEFALSQKEV